MPMSAAQRVAVTERRTEAVRLAASGMGYSQIAERLGFHDRSGAYKAVTAALRAQQAGAVGELRRLECERLDRLQASMWDAAIAGDIPSVDRCLRVIAARVRLLGLDQGPDKPVSVGGRLVSMDWQPRRDVADQSAAN